MTVAARRGPVSCDMLMDNALSEAGSGNGTTEAKWSSIEPSFWSGYETPVELKQRCVGGDQYVCKGVSQMRGKGRCGDQGSSKT